MTLCIRELEEADIAVCAEIMVSSEPWITLGITQEHAKQTFKKHLDIGAAYVGSTNSRVVAFIIFHVKGAFPLGGYVKAIGVHRKHREKGIATKLMEFAEERIFRESPNVFLLVSSFNKEAQRFYTRLGYAKIGEIKDAIVKGYSEYIMRKTP